MACTYAGQTYSEGALLCIGGIWHICENGKWENAGFGTCDSVNSDFKDYITPCMGLGWPPNYIPTPPFVPHTPTPDELVKCINHWTYLWTVCGNFWMHVLGVIQGRTNQVVGCVLLFDQQSGHWFYYVFYVPLVDITNYFMQP